MSNSVNRVLEFEDININFESGEGELKWIQMSQLKEEKIIRKFSIDLAPEKVDKGFMAYVLVSVSLPILKQKKKTQHDLIKEMRSFYFIERADTIYR